MTRTYIEFISEGKVIVKEDTVSEDNLAPMEVIIKNETTLVSAGTEMARLYNKTGGMTYPIIPGYASIGRIVKKGSEVNDFEVGDRVFYAGKHASVERFLHGQNHQWGRLYPVPESISSEEAPFVCLAEIAMMGPFVSEITPNDTVGVFGLGLIGNFAAQIYKIWGAKVIGLDPVKERCDTAKECGIESVISVETSKQSEAIKESTNGKMLDISVDAVGHSMVVKTCVDNTALYGQVILLGTPWTACEGNLTDILLPTHLNCMTIRGAHMWQMPASDMREVKQTVEWAYRTIFEYMEEGKLKVAPLLSHKVKASDAPSLYDNMKNNPDKYRGVIFEW